MKLNIFYALSALPLLAAARPADDNVVHKQDGSIIVGPQAYEELQATVEGLKSGGKLGDLAACSGLYLCEHADFKGRCYWGCYPNGLDVYPDPFWQENITAVGPDRDVLCIIWGGSCKGGRPLLFRHPGGNLPREMNDDVACFNCNPDMVVTRTPSLPAPTSSPR